MKRNNARAALQSRYRGATWRPPAGGKAPPNAVTIEARNAYAAAAAQPLAHVFGEPPPGRSALDKMRREGRRVF